METLREKRGRQLRKRKSEMREAGCVKLNEKRNGDVNKKPLTRNDVVSRYGLYR
jgi:hypothetical protein